MDCTLQQIVFSRATGHDQSYLHCSSIWPTGLWFCMWDSSGGFLYLTCTLSFFALVQWAELCVFCVHRMAEALCTWLPTKATLMWCVSCSKLAATWTFTTTWVGSSICQLRWPCFNFHPLPALALRSWMNFQTHNNCSLKTSSGLKWDSLTCRLVCRLWQEEEQRRQWSRAGKVPGGSVRVKASVPPILSSLNKLPLSLLLLHSAHFLCSLELSSP